MNNTCFCLLLSAQALLLAKIDAQGFLDIHAGANLSNYQLYQIQFTPKADQQSIAGLQLGVTPGWAFSSKWEISAPAQYVSRGYWAGIPGGLPSLSKSERLHYFEVSPALGFRPLPHLSVFAGGYASIPLLHQKNEGEGWEPWNNSGSQNWDAGLTAGLRSAHGSFTAFVRYFHGLVEIPSAFGASTDAGYLPGFFFNRNFQFGVGYSLMKMKKNNRSMPLSQ